MRNIKRLNEKIRNFAVKANIAIRKGLDILRNPLTNNDGFGKEEIIGIALTLIVAAFIIFPGVRSFATTLMNNMDTWYDTSIKSNIFETK